MAWVATENFREVDRLLSGSNPTATLHFKTLGPDARMLLRYHASEENRWYFQSWETGQIIFGTFFFFFMLFGSRENVFVLAGVLLMLALVLVQRFVLTPELIALGRLIDFVPVEVHSPDRSRFWVVHGTYTIVELTKWVLALVLTGKMVFSRKRSGRSRDSRSEFNSVNKANYGSVNR